MKAEIVETGEMIDVEFIGNNTILVSPEDYTKMMSYVIPKKGEEKDPVFQYTMQLSYPKT